MRILSRRIRYWSLAISLLLLFDVVPTVPYAIEAQSILRHRVETMGRLTTAQPDGNGLVYYAYDTKTGSFGGYYKPKESSLPFLQKGAVVTVTYSEIEPWKHTLGHELPERQRQYLIFSFPEIFLAAVLLLISFPKRIMKTQNSRR